MNTGFRKRRRALVAATSALFVAAGIAVASVRTTQAPMTTQRERALAVKLDSAASMN